MADNTTTLPILCNLYNNSTSQQITTTKIADGIFQKELTLEQSNNFTFIASIDGSSVSGQYALTGNQETISSNHVRFDFANINDGAQYFLSVPQGNWIITIDFNTNKLDLEVKQTTEPTLPEKLFLFNYFTNQLLGMSKIEDGVFTYSGQLSGSYEFVTETSSPYGEIWAKGELSEETSNPFYQKYSLIKSGSDLISINSNGKEYDLLVNLNDNTLKINEKVTEPTYEDSIYYIRGEINSWDANAAYRLKTDGKIHFIENVTLVGEFKFANDDWSNDYGSNGSSTEELDLYFKEGVTEFSYDGMSGGGNLSFIEPRTFSKIELTPNKRGASIKFTLSEEVTTIPEQLFISKDNTEEIEMIVLQKGIFVYSGQFEAGSYKFQDSTKENVYTMDGLVSSTTDPFYQKYDIINGGAAAQEYTLETNGKYRFKVDLINNTFEIYDISNPTSTSTTGYPYLINSSGETVYFNNEGDSFFSLENIQLGSNCHIYSFSTDTGWDYFYTGNSNNIEPDTKYSLQKISGEADINFTSKTYKRLEVYLGSSAYLIAYEDTSTPIEPVLNNSFKIGDTEIKKIYLGSTEIKRIYLGSTKIYEA